MTTTHITPTSAPARARAPTASHPVGASVRRMLLASWQQRRNQGSLALYLVLVAVLAVLPGIILIEFGFDRRAVVPSFIVGGFEITFVLAGVWLAIASNLIDQNQPALARLVPSHVRDLRIALMLGWTAIVAVSVGLVASLPTLPVDLPLVVAIAAMVATGIVLVSRWFGNWMIFVVVPIVIEVFEGSAAWNAGVAQLRAAWAAAPWTIAGVVLACCVVLNLTVFQAGGDKHMRNHERRARVRARMRRRSLGLQVAPAATTPSTGWAARLTRAYEWPYRAAMARQQARPAAMMPRLMLALGPQAHWTTQLLNIAIWICVVALAAVAVRVFSDPVHSPGLAGNMLSGWMIGAIYAFAAPVLMLPGRLHQARREQALLALLPGVPRGPALSRALSTRLTWQFLGTWIVGIGAMTAGRAAGRWLGVDGQLAGLAALGDVGRLLALSLLLPIGPSLWRNWSRMGAPTQASMLWLLGLPALAAAGAWWAMDLHLVSLAGVGVLFAGIALAWCASRWQRMGAEPTAFPVGRLR